MNTLIQTPLFVGWIRLPGGCWRAVVNGATDDAAWHLLHNHAAELKAKSIDLLVARAGNDPNDSPRPR